MYKILLSAVCCVFASVCLSDVVNPGDSEEQALKALGAPDGRIATREGTLWLYEDGKVLVADGVVARVDFLSDEEVFLKEKDHKRSIQANREFEADRQARIKEGLAVKKRQLANMGFLSQSASNQLRYWKSFQRSYPGVDVSTEVRLLNQQVMAEQAQRERLAQERLARSRAVRNPGSGGYILYRGGYTRCRPRPVVQPAGVTEYEDTTFFVPDLKNPPGGKIPSAAKPRPGK